MRDVRSRWVPWSRWWAAGRSSSGPKPSPRGEGGLRRLTEAGGRMRWTFDKLSTSYSGLCNRFHLIRLASLGTFPSRGRLTGKTAEISPRWPRWTPRPPWSLWWAGTGSRPARGSCCSRRWSSQWAAGRSSSGPKPSPRGEGGLRRLTEAGGRMRWTFDKLSTSYSGLCNRFHLIRLASLGTFPSRGRLTGKTAEISPRWPRWTPRPPWSLWWAGTGSRPARGSCCSRRWSSQWAAGRSRFGRRCS